MYLTLLALGLVSDEFRHKVFKDSLRTLYQDTRHLSFVRSRVGCAVLRCACCIKIANHLRAADPSLAHGFCRIVAMLCPPTAPAFVLRRYCLRTVVSRYHFVSGNSGGVDVHTGSLQTWFLYVVGFQHALHESVGPWGCLVTLASKGNPAIRQRQASICTNRYFQFFLQVQLHVSADHVCLARLV